MTDRKLIHPEFDRGTSRKAEFDQFLEWRTDRSPQMLMRRQPKPEQNRVCNVVLLLKGESLLVGYLMAGRIRTRLCAGKVRWRAGLETPNIIQTTLPKAKRTQAVQKTQPTRERRAANKNSVARVL